jgi:hypothetical protein
MRFTKNTGGEGGIRTPDTLTGMSDFESGAFNRALPPLRIMRPPQDCVGLSGWIRSRTLRDSSQILKGYPLLELIRWSSQVRYGHVQSTRKGV